MLKEIFTKKSNRSFLIVGSICVVLLLCGTIVYVAIPGFQNRVNSLIGISTNNTTDKSSETATTEKTTEDTTTSPDINTDTAPSTTATPGVNTTTPTTTPAPTSSPNPTTAPSTTTTPEVNTTTPATTPSHTPTTAPIAFQVSSATASVSPESGPSICNKQTSFEFIFSGTITVTAAGSVQYKWVQSNGVESAGTLTFSSAGSKSVPANSWIVYGGGLFTGWGKIVVTSPNSISSNQANFTRLFCPLF